MPELPEVDAGRRIVEQVGVGRRIVAVRCADDPIVFERVSPARLRSALLGRRVVGAHRHGKHLWIELDRRPWPVIHFGMTGGLHAQGVRRVRLQSYGTAGPGAEWPPRFTKLHLTLDDGGELAFADARRLGRVRLRRDPRAEAPVSLLGFDALLGLPSPARFRELLRERSAPIKALLLDQTFAAGVGNWIADEVLYQARISPRRPARSLAAEEARRLRGALRTVVATAVRAGADSERFPKLWLFHVRWERHPGVVTPRGERIRRETIGGRTAAWVPSVQR